MEAECRWLSRGDLPLGATKRTLLARANPLEDAVQVKYVLARAPHGSAVVARKFTVLRRRGTSRHDTSTAINKTKQ